MTDVVISFVNVHGEEHLYVMAYVCLGAPCSTDVPDCLLCPHINGSQTELNDTICSSQTTMTGV